MRDEPNGLPSVALACAWRPRGELGRWRRVRSLLEAQYERIVVAIPSNADAGEAERLRSVLGVDVVISPQLFWTRHTALKRALDLGEVGADSGAGLAHKGRLRRDRRVDHIHYADGDRLLHWIETRPDEWHAALAEIARVDCLIFGRSEAALRSHPQCMQQTEAIINTVGSFLLGMPVDLGGGSRGLSRQATQLAVDLCPPERFGDAAWPILAQRAGLRVAYRAVDGLEWETPDHYPDAAADAEARRQRAAEIDALADRWQKRVRTAHEIVQEAVEAAALHLPSC